DEVPRIRTGDAAAHAEGLDLEGDGGRIDVGDRDRSGIDGRGEESRGPAEAAGEVEQRPDAAPSSEAPGHDLGRRSEDRARGREVPDRRGFRAAVRGLELESVHLVR